MSVVIQLKLSMNFLLFYLEVSNIDIVMRSFTLIGGLSIEFHAIPIFTVLAVKMRKISGE